MNQEERRKYLLNYLIDEREEEIEIPEGEKEQRELLRGLMNVRKPWPVTPEFEEIQDEYLQLVIGEKGITTMKMLTEREENIYLWQGDITTLKLDAIVNAANESLLGCFIPNHNCIDNVIHSHAGVQLRRVCDELIKRQRRKEPTGSAAITSAFNLPARYVIHTVGPRVEGGRPTRRDEMELASCYRSCMEKAEEHNLRSIAFCSISTGEFGFPKRRAAEIAYDTVKAFQEHSDLKAVFDVYSDEDYEIYDDILNG